MVDTYFLGPANPILSDSGAVQGSCSVEKVKTTAAHQHQSSRGFTAEKDSPAPEGIPELPKRREVENDKVAKRWENGSRLTPFQREGEAALCSPSWDPICWHLGRYLIVPYLKNL